MHTSSSQETSNALPIEDGTSAANQLPLDRQLASTPFETATFGLG